MLVLVKVFGIAIMAAGTIFAAKPQVFKQYIGFWRQQKRLYAGGVLSLSCGIVFLLAASQCRLTGVITVLGIWSIIKGVLLFTIGQKRINVYMDWWEAKPVSAIRILGVLALAMGVLIIYSV